MRFVYDRNHAHFMDEVLQHLGVPVTQDVPISWELVAKTFPQHVPRILHIIEHDLDGDVSLAAYHAYRAGMAPLHWAARIILNSRDACTEAVAALLVDECHVASAPLLENTPDAAMAAQLAMKIPVASHAWSHWRQRFVARADASMYLRAIDLQRYGLRADVDWQLRLAELGLVSDPHVKIITHAFNDVRMCAAQAMRVFRPAAGHSPPWNALMLFYVDGSRQRDWLHQFLVECRSAEAVDVAYYLHRKDKWPLATFVQVLEQVSSEELPACERLVARICEDDQEALEQARAVFQQRNGR